MGSESFVLKAEGADVGSVFDFLVEEYTYNNGHDAYNGTIATCTLGYCRKAFETYDKDNEIIARQIIKEHSGGTKWRADYIDLGIVYYDEIKVTKTPRKYDAKYETRIGVFDEYGTKLVKSDAHFDIKSKSDAENFAINYAKEKGIGVVVKKFKRKISGNDILSEFTTTIKKLDKKPKRIKKDANIVPIHAYMFYGYAAN